MNNPRATITDPGMFQGQPAWTQDFYQNVVLNGGAASMHIHWCEVSEAMRERYDLPQDAAAVVLLHPSWDTQDARATGVIYNREEFGSFIADLVFQKHINLRPLLSSAMAQLIRDTNPKLEAQMSPAAPQPHEDFPIQEEEQDDRDQQIQAQEDQAQESIANARRANALIQQFNQAVLDLNISGFAMETHPDPGEHMNLEVTMYLPDGTLLEEISMSSYQ